MTHSAEVDAWFAERRPPAETAMQRVRDVVLAADPRMTETVQYGTVVFAYQGGMASIVQPKESRVNLMFHRGARIKGDFPHLEGDGPSARFMRFTDVADVEAQAGELTDVVRAWCALVAPH